MKVKYSDIVWPILAVLAITPMFSIALIRGNEVDRLKTKSEFWKQTALKYQIELASADKAVKSFRESWRICSIGRLDIERILDKCSEKYRECRFCVERIVREQAGVQDKLMTKEDHKSLYKQWLKSN